MGRENALKISKVGSIRFIFDPSEVLGIVLPQLAID
jgi:hypothetical protein